MPGRVWVGPVLNILSDESKVCEHLCHRPLNRWVSLALASFESAHGLLNCRTDGKSAATRVSGCRLQTSALAACHSLYLCQIPGIREFNKCCSSRAAKIMRLIGVSDRSLRMLCTITTITRCTGRLLLGLRAQAGPLAAVAAVVPPCSPVMVPHKSTQTISVGALVA